MKAWSIVAASALLLFLGIPGLAQTLPLRFHQVTPSIYRGARPDADGIAALAGLKIKTILDLEDDREAVAREKVIANSFGIELVSTPMSGFWRPKAREISQSLQVLADPARQPVYVHCLHGQDRTGLVVGLYRVFYENWMPETAWKEMSDLGFHRLLFFLKEYYEKATGFEI